MQIRAARLEDAPAIMSIIRPVIDAGETYSLDPSMSDEDLTAYWLSADKQSFVAEEEGKLLGTYYIRANQAGGGGHVCNCGYVTAAEAMGRGVARRMCGDSLDRARSMNYRSMQFNFVVSTNERAVALWQAMGFKTEGRLPNAFRHPVFGYVDALVMYRDL